MALLPELMLIAKALSRETANCSTFLQLDPQSSTALRIYAESTGKLHLEDLGRRAALISSPVEQEDFGRDPTQLESGQNSVRKTYGPRASWAGLSLVPKWWCRMAMFFCV